MTIHSDNHAVTRGVHPIGLTVPDLAARSAPPVSGNEPPSSLSPFRDLRPPFTRDTALAKVQAAEDAWNSRDPERVAQAYTENSDWRNRDECFQGRHAIMAFLRRKWATELDYRLMKELWAYTDNRISVRFECEWHDATGQWYRTHGNEHWEFDAAGLMQRRDMSANDLAIRDTERRLWASRPKRGFSEANAEKAQPIRRSTNGRTS